MKKILVITYYWPPSGGAGVQRWLKFVKYFSEYGLQPIVITVDPAKASYPVLDDTLTGEVPADVQVFRTNTSEPYQWYKKISGKKNIPYAGFANESKPSMLQKTLRFVRGNFFIPDARVGWNRFAVKKAAAIIEKEQIACIITSSPPHSTQLVGLELKKKYGLPWIADLRDPWTDIYYYEEMNHTKFAKKKDAGYEKNVLESADRVVTTSHSTRRDLLKKSEKINEDKIHVIPNGYDEEDFNLNSSPPINEFIITYTGTLTAAYPIDGFIEALKVVMKQHDIIYKLRFVGQIPQDVIKQIKMSGLAEIVEAIPHVAHARAIQYMKESTVLLLIIPETKRNKGIIPGKLFEYIAAEKPIICLSPKDGDAASVIDECEAGKVFEYQMATAMTDHLNQLSDEWKRNPNMDLSAGKHFRYSKKVLSKQIAALISAVS